MQSDSAKSTSKLYGSLKGTYSQKSVRQRIEALFLDNIGKILTREQIQEAATDPVSKKTPENWHQRLSELRTDTGYTIMSWRDRKDLKVEEYLMPTAVKRETAGKRVKPSAATWQAVLKRADNCCEWNEGGQQCALKTGDIDPVGGGRVKLTADHNSPHSVNPKTDPNDPTQWQALCGRHQVIKKNFWDSSTGKLNVYSIVQAATHKEKKLVFDFLSAFFGYTEKHDGTLTKQ